MIDRPFDLQPAALGLSLNGQPLPDFAERIAAPHGTSPPRRANSVRRTMSIDVTWPDGMMQPSHLLGRTRDVRTRAAGSAPELLAQAEALVVAADRQIVSISATPTPPGLQSLVGVRAGGYLRNALAECIPEERAAGTPLYLVLDDMAGSTLVSRWGLSQWDAERMAAMVPRRSMEGICIGFRPGASSLEEIGNLGRHARVPTRVVPLVNPADPAGWHELPALPDGPHFRRARRIDIWREGGELVVETLFQDSAAARDGGDRPCIHEYKLEARIGTDGTVRSLEATPGVLPFSSCRVAPVNNVVLLGTRSADLRDVVLEKLKLTGGCTHLNDTLRSLAETEILASHLPG